MTLKLCNIAHVRKTLKLNNMYFESFFTLYDPNRLDILDFAIARK